MNSLFRNILRYVHMKVKTSYTIYSLETKLKYQME